MRMLLVDESNEIEDRLSWRLDCCVMMADQLAVLKAL